MHGNLVTFPVSLLDGGVVGILVRDEVSGFDIASVRVLAFAVKDLFVEFDVVVVDGIVEGDGDHLRDVLGRQVTGDDCAVFGAEAVGQHALRGVTRRRSVGVVVDICLRKTLLLLGVRCIRRVK